MAATKIIFTGKVEVTIVSQDTVELHFPYIDTEVAEIVGMTLAAAFVDANVEYVDREEQSHES